MSKPVIEIIQSARECPTLEVRRAVCSTNDNLIGSLPPLGGNHPYRQRELLRRVIVSDAAFEKRIRAWLDKALRSRSYAPAWIMPRPVRRYFDLCAALRLPGRVAGIPYSIRVVTFQGTSPVLMFSHVQCERKVMPGFCRFMCS